MDIVYDSEVKSDSEDMAIALGNKPGDIRVAHKWSLLELFERHLQEAASPLNIVFEYNLSVGWEHQIELLSMVSPHRARRMWLPGETTGLLLWGSGPSDSQGL